MPEQPKRLLSIDALRGFDMFFISGGATFLHILHGKTGIAWVEELAGQLEHAVWNGFSFYDFIMPLFLFISGVSLSFSISKNSERGFAKTDLYKKAFKRMVILIILGIIYKNSPVPFFEPSQIRFGSVLGRIGFATFITTVLYLNFSTKQRVLWISGILLAYYAALKLIPVPGYGAGDLSFEGNLVGWFDQNFMPGILKQKTYDELALLTQLPALCLTIMGAWAGDILRKLTFSDKKKLQLLILIGVSSIIIGLTWSLHFPINKRLWSSSFIALTGGMGLLVLALFYWIIDVKKIQKWAFFFKVIGMNSLVIYFAYSFINFDYTVRRLIAGLISPLGEMAQEVLVSIGVLGLIWLFMYFLYRYKFFIKV